MNTIDLYTNNLIAVVAMMAAGWLFSLTRRSVNIVDSLWGMGFVLISWLTWFQIDDDNWRALLMAGLTTLWGIRLSVHLAWRNFGKPEDPRYALWRQAGGNKFWLISLFKVFMLQAVFLWVIALVIQAGQTGDAKMPPGVMEMCGMLIWLVGFGFETVGDWQLARFKADPANRGRVMNRGLWRYTRHPNYFGECLIWWGLFVIALADPANWWTVISPIVITAVLLKMTGIALTEKLSIEKRPGYREYIMTTPAFFPWMPKQRTTVSETYDENTDPTG